MTYMSVLAPTFALHFSGARHHTMIAESTSPFEASAGATYYLAEDWLSGYVVRADGELTNVWSVERGRGGDIVESAITNGATHLDCFDGYLTALYSRHGFQRVTSLPNWTPGDPDVVYMALPDHFISALDKAERTS